MPSQIWDGIFCLNRLCYKINSFLLKLYLVFYSFPFLGKFNNVAPNPPPKTRKPSKPASLWLDPADKYYAEGVYFASAKHRRQVN
jgi:hypothetical protein